MGKKIIPILEEDIPSNKGSSHHAYTQIWKSLLCWDCHRLMMSFWQNNRSTLGKHLQALGCDYLLVTRRCKVGRIALYQRCFVNWWTLSSSLWRNFLPLSPSHHSKSPWNPVPLLDPLISTFFSQTCILKASWNYSQYVLPQEGSSSVSTAIWSALQPSLWQRSEFGSLSSGPAAISNMLVRTCTRKNL